MDLNIIDFQKAVNAKILTNFDCSDVNIQGGYVSDLLSDVMGSAKSGDVWITIMRHLNVVAVASLAGISAIVFSKGVVPDKAIIDKANDEEICLLSSEKTTFELAGILYQYQK